MDEWEKAYREDFYRITGKTPEEEADDSMRGLVFGALVGAILWGLVGWGLIAYFW